MQHTKVETLVGKGVFKLSCRKEELILYSNEGKSEEWVDEITKTIEQHKKDQSTLRKESSRREPLKVRKYINSLFDSILNLFSFFRDPKY